MTLPIRNSKRQQFPPGVGGEKMRRLLLHRGLNLSLSQGLCCLLSQRHLRFGFISLLLHDIKNHTTRFGAPLWRCMDSDGLLSGTRVFLPMDVNPMMKQPAERSPLRCV